MSTPYRILIYQETLPDYRIPFFNALGRESELLVVYGGPTPLKDVKPNLSLIKNFKAVALSRKGSASGLLSYHQGLFETIQRFHPDALIAEPRLGLIGIWRMAFTGELNKRLIWWLSGHEPEEKSWKRKIRRGLRKILYTKAKSFVVYGSAGEEYVRFLSCRQPVFIAYNAVGSEEIKSAREQLIRSADFLKKKSNYRVGNVLSLLYVGRISADKKTELLPEIVRYLSEILGRENVGMIIIGDGPSLETLKEKVEAAGLSKNFHFTGALYGNDRLAPYFLSADIFVLPGKGGLAMNEAIQYGLPVVVGQADGTEKDMVINGKNGVIVSGQASHAFANAILEISLNKDVLQKMGQASLEIAGLKSNTGMMKEGFLKAVSSLQQINQG